MTARHYKPSDSSMPLLCIVGGDEACDLHHSTHNPVTALSFMGAHPDESRHRQNVIYKTEKTQHPEIKQRLFFVNTN